MEHKTKQEGDIEKINKITGYQLPNKFKIVGLVLFIVSFILVPVISSYFGELKHHDLFQRIAWTFAVLGLLIISISKEKIEDELIAKIRMQSYNYTVIGTVLCYLIFPFINFTIVSIFSSMPKIEGSKDIPLLGVMLIMQIFTFRKLKKSFDEE
jgi:hypothetical protein